MWCRLAWRCRNLTRMQRLRTCAAWRPDTVGYRDPVVATKLSLKSLARRILDINDEIAELDWFIVPLAPVEYATVAQSLRSLRPHHSRIPPAQAFRPSWLRCERVTQRVITTGHPASEDCNIAMESIMQNFISTETSSQTAMACEQAALFGATPGPDEFDNREIWNEDEALAGIEEAIHILAGAVAPDGTQLADERESLLWGFVNALNAQVQRLDRGIDKIAPEMKDLGQEQDGSEIKSRELERLTDRVQTEGGRLQSVQLQSTESALALSSECSAASSNRSRSARAAALSSA